MDRKHFLAQLWKWLLLPLTLIGAGIFIVYALTYIITELKLSDFLVAWVIIPFALAFIVLTISLNYLREFIKKQYHQLPESIRITLKQYARFTNQTIDWIFPFIAGGLMYHFWTTGNKTMALALMASIIVRKVKEHQNRKNEQYINNVPTHTTT
jgi:hypothetical protein